MVNASASGSYVAMVGTSLGGGPIGPTSRPCMTTRLASCSSSADLPLCLVGLGDLIDVGPAAVGLPVLAGALDELDIRTLDEDCENRQDHECHDTKLDQRAERGHSV